MINNKLYWAKTSKAAIIPTKIEENAGYDLYALPERRIVIRPMQTVMIPIGISSAFSSDYYAQICERGSIGTKGISVQAGVIDSGYRGAWNVVLTNNNRFPIVISDERLGTEESRAQDVELWNCYNGIIKLEITKAIAQVVFLPVPKFEVEEISIDELKEIPSERGDGKLGSSGK